MNVLQVDHFQQIPINALKLVKKLAHIEGNIQTNYTLGDTSLNSLVDFATNQTTFNEAIHLFQIPINASLLLEGAVSGHIDSIVAVNASALLINTYCVLAQRYSRARLSITIDKALRRNREFDPEKYSNTLGIRFPEHKSENQ